MPAEIFISYRREDNPHAAGRIYDRLVGVFSEESVFMDLTKIPYGENFKEYLSKRVNRCDILLAIVGDSWLSVKTANGIRRIDDPDDLVRMELEIALNRHIPVIPVLVGRTTSMPLESELPDPIKDFAYRQAVDAKPGIYFGYQLDRLVTRLSTLLNYNNVLTAGS